MYDKSLRKPIILITYTGFLFLAIFRYQEILAFIKTILTALSPVFTGFAMAFVLTEPCVFFDKWIQKFFPKMKSTVVNGIAVLLTYLSLLILCFGLISVVIPKLADSISIFISSIKTYTSNFQVWLNSLALETESEMLAEASVDLSGLVSTFSTHLEKILERAMSTATTAASQVMAMTGGLLTLVVDGVIATVFSIYMLADRKNLRRQCRRILFAYIPKKRANKILEITRLTADTFAKFVAGQLLEACILGGLCAIGVVFIQPDYALLIGIIIGVSALVPVAGAYIGGGVSFVLLFMVSPVSSLVFMVFLVILQQIEGNLIYPRVVGNSIGLPGLWVVFAVIVGGNLFGLLGILLSVPCVSVGYTLFRAELQRKEALVEKKKTAEP